MQDCRSVVSLPASFCRLSNLKKLNLGSSSYRNPMKLESLPERFGQLGNLRELNMGGCKSLLSLPDSFCDLSNLTKLSFCDEYGIGCEKLESLPERFGQLKSLKELNLRLCDSLKELPAGIPPHILPPLSVALAISNRPCIN